MSTASIVGMVMPPLNSASHLNGIQALRDVCNTIVEYRKVIADEKCRQEAIRARRDAVVQAIHAQRDIILKISDDIFAERRETLREMFRQLDRASDGDDADRFGAVLGGIVTLVKHSPIADIRSMMTEMSSNKFVLDLSSD